jgi:hypothetical protein
MVQSFSTKIFRTPFSTKLHMSSTPEPSFKDRLFQDMKQAMINKDKSKLAAIRSIQAAIKQKEVDDRVEVT